MNDELDPQAELERLRQIPLDERSGEVEKLIEELENQLEERSPRPSSKA